MLTPRRGVSLQHSCTMSCSGADGPTAYRREVCHHLRGEAGDRQIEGAKVGLAHVIGLGSACGVHILEKAA